jgi:hypothetical protein
MAEESRRWYKTSVELGFGAVGAVPVAICVRIFFEDLKFMSEAGSGPIRDKIDNFK